MSAKIFFAVVLTLATAPGLMAYKVDSIVAEIGGDGTDDSVTVTLDDTRGAKCTTPELKSALWDDWSAGDVEEWDSGYLGPCAGFQFDDRLRASLTKKGAYGSEDYLDVDKLTVKTEEGASFNCRSFSLGLQWGNADVTERNPCPPE